MAINYELLNKGGISLGTNFELLSEKPLDSRLVVPSLSGLQNYIDNAAAYEGMIAYVTSEKKHYEVKVIDGVLSYRPFGLTEAELNDLITNATTAAMEFKGATATLPDNPAKGDMYKVAGENINIKIDDVDAKLGDSIVYDGEKWFLIPSGDDIEDTWRPVDGVNNDAALKFVDGDKTVAAVAADGTIKYNHATVAAPADVTAEGDEKTRTYITAVETDGYGHITGYKTATENVEDTNTEYTFESQVESSSVYFNVTPSTEGATEQTIYVDAYSKNEADAAFKAKRAEALAAVETDANVFVDTVAQDVDGNITITTKAVDFSGIIGTPSDDASAMTFEGTRKYAEQLKDEVVGDASTAKMDDRTIEGVYKSMAEAASQAGEGAFRAEQNAKGYTDEELAKLGTMAKENAADYYTKTEADAAFTNSTEVDGQIDAKITALDLANTYQTKGDYAAEEHTHIASEITDLDTTIKGYDYATKAEAQAMADGKDEAIEAAQKTADDITSYVGTFTHDTAKTVVDYINAKTDGIATSGNLEALGQRVTAVEGDVATIKGDYLKAADIADFETKENVKKVADDLAAYVESNDAALAAETKARTDADAGFETRIAALEGNFGDGEGTVEAQIEAAVAAEKQRAEGIEGGLRTDVNAVAGRMDTAEGKITALEAESAKHAVKTEVEGALALKADKSVVDAMYTNAQIDGFIAEAKKYADDNDADTQYGIEYDPKTKTIKLVSDTSKTEIDATDFIKDGMIESVELVQKDDKDNEGQFLKITWNDDDGDGNKDVTYVPVGELVDVYTAGAGATEVQVAISNTNEVTATLVNKGVTTEKIADNAVTAAKIADMAVSNEKLGLNAITTGYAMGQVVQGGTSRVGVQENGRTSLAIELRQKDLYHGGGAPAGDEGSLYLFMEGDTVPYANVAHDIDDGIVVTAKIADKNVTKAKLAEDVQASLALADTALQAADKAALEKAIADGDATKVSIGTVDDTAGMLTGFGLLNQITAKSKEAEDNAKGYAYDELAKLGTMAKETATNYYTKYEVAAAIEAALTEAHTWGEF